MMVIVDQEGLFVQLTPLRRRVERVRDAPSGVECLRGAPGGVERVGVAARQTSS
jgi:hypothetical protein